jgi:DNA-directed RNA polymerase specialized sigma24 family protein
MQYIRENEAEILLEKYRGLRGMIQNIRIQMQNVIESSEARIAIEHEKSLSIETQKALKELRSELLLLEMVVDKIDTALSAIQVLQKDILVMRYCEKLVFAEIADKLFVSATKIKQKRKDALKRFCPLSRITMEEFEKVVKLFNYENGGE